MNLNANLKKRISHLGFTVPEVLFPADGIDLSTWSVIACDQYTSDHAYWKAVEGICAGKPSTLHITLPEIYLKAPDIKEKIGRIQNSMAAYAKDGTLRSLGEGIMYIERRTHSGLRQGLLVAMDLEHYDYAPDSKTLTRATEGTIVDRIPPRLAIREKASVELPHIMILIDDPQQGIIESLAGTFKNPPLYDIDLMQEGGNVKGWFIDTEPEVEALLGKMENLKITMEKNQATTSPLIFAMGDGNHSLATAKASWVAIKKNLKVQGLPEEKIMAHPARFALAELVNIHSPGLHFEPIHRAVFTTKPQEYLATLRTYPGLASFVECPEVEIRKFLETEAAGQFAFGAYDGKKWFLASLEKDCPLLPPAIADKAFEAFKGQDSASDIDFIHGWQDTTKLVQEGAVAVMLPVIARDLLFKRVEKFGPLPRKAFSMGEAEEKRYYVEARKIVP